VAVRPALAAAVAVAGGAMVGFALLVHHGLPWGAGSALALALAGASIGLTVHGGTFPLATQRGGRSALVRLAAAGILVGAVGGVFQCRRAGLVPLGSGLHPFVLLACLIGAAEELVYRGWMFERLAHLGGPAAAVLSALAHAAYKTALFAWPPDAVGGGSELWRIALWTVVGGIFLGVLRLRSRSVLPPVLGHVAFDAVVYSAFAAPPWWVWG
jgi:membrane protease YdiL (CAAX protease family)